MSDYEHQLRLENQISQLSGKQDRVIDAIQSLKSVAEKAFAPEYTLDELTIPSNLYKDFASYGYLYNYIFVGDSDAGVTLTIGNRIQTHTITLNGGWNQIHLFDNGWWKASSVINVMLLRSKKDMSTYIGGGGSASSPLYASLTGSSATIGNVGVVGGSGNQLDLFQASTIGDGQGFTAQSSLLTINTPWLYNGSNWDTQRNNTQGTLLASAARTASGFSANQINFNAKGVLVHVIVTNYAGTSPTLIPSINTIDELTGDITGLYNAPAITGNGQFSYELYPGIAAPSSGSVTGFASLSLPRNWNFGYALGGTSPSFTFSASYQLIN